MEGALRQQVLLHHLRLFGCDHRVLRSIAVISGDAPDRFDALASGLGSCQLIVLHQPGLDLCASLGIAVNDRVETAPVEFYISKAPASRRRLRSLHRVRLYSHPEGLPVAVLGTDSDTLDGAVWLRISHGNTDILILGSAVAEDLVRYRQGDPAQVTVGQVGLVADFAHERANYLFEAQRAGEPRHERHADVIAAALADIVTQMLGLVPLPVLPNGVLGAVVITGDDDQAYVERYAEQIDLLGGLPVTYFLHPLTRLTPPEMRRLFAGKRVELGLHPDALDDTGRYAITLTKQANWFRRFAGFPAVSVRNHGFLNAGYWDYVPSWQMAGLHVSSNVTAADGTALNGSYLPSRVALGGQLTDHWSILTALGDGLLFAYAQEPEAAADKVLAAGDAIIQSGIPGVLVLNLHPQNVDRSAAIHHAVHDLVHSGFHAWTLRDCIAWFERRDTGRVSLPEAAFGGTGLIDRLLGRIKRPGRHPMQIVGSKR